MFPIFLWFLTVAAWGRFRVHSLPGVRRVHGDPWLCCATPVGNAVKDFESFNPWPRGQVVQTRCGLASRPRVKRLSFSVQESLTALPCRGWKTHIVPPTERPPCLLLEMLHSVAFRAEHSAAGCRIQSGSRLPQSMGLIVPHIFCVIKNERHVRTRGRRSGR